MHPDTRAVHPARPRRRFSETIHGSSSEPRFAHGAVTPAVEPGCDSVLLEWESALAGCEDALEAVAFTNGHAASRALAEARMSHSPLTVVDNSWVTGVLDQPLRRGADVVIYADGCFLSGSADLPAGALITNSPDLAARFRRARHAHGSAPDPFTAFRLFQSVKTLPLRMRAQHSSAHHLAARLRTCACIVDVSAHAPAVHERGEGDALASDAITTDGGSRRGPVLWISLHPDIEARALIRDLSIPLVSEMIGAIRSSVWPVHTPSFAPQIIRYSVGLENVEDLAEDVIFSIERCAQRVHDPAAEHSEVSRLAHPSHE